jgi:hypothetical protein
MRVLLHHGGHAVHEVFSIYGNPGEEDGELSCEKHKRDSGTECLSTS